MAKRSTARRPVKLSDQVRQAMDESGLSRYAIAKALNINESALGKFYHGERGIAVDTLDRLAELLELRLVGPKRRRKANGT